MKGTLETVVQVKRQKDHRQHIEGRVDRVLERFFHHVVQVFVAGGIVPYFTKFKAEVEVPEVNQQEKALKARPPSSAKSEKLPDACTIKNVHRNKPVRAMTTLRPMELETASENQFISENKQK